MPVTTAFRDQFVILKDSAPRPEAVVAGQMEGARR
jgi:hypothetical protein